MVPPSQLHTFDIGLFGQKRSLSKSKVDSWDDEFIVYSFILTCVSIMSYYPITYFLRR